MISRCDGYSEEILTKNNIILYVPQFYADRFFLNNAQLKVRYFGKEKLKIRVPREYVDITDDYYYSRNVRYRLSNNRFSWEEKKGRLRQNYFYAKIPIVDNRVPWIKRMRITTFCMYDSIYTNSGDDHGFLECGTGLLVGWRLRLDLELGLFYQTDSLTGYFTLGGSYNRVRSTASILGGINTHASFYGSLRYQFNFMALPLRGLRITKRWDEVGTGTPLNYVGRLYVGTEVKASFNK